jgi:cytochrome c551
MEEADMRLVLSVLLLLAVTALVLLTAYTSAEPTALAAGASIGEPQSGSGGGSGSSDRYGRQGGDSRRRSGDHRGHDHGDDDDDEDGNPIEGRRIFLRENCYGCHGGRAGGGMCPSLREDPPDEDDVEEAVLEGTENGMPSYAGRLNRRDIANLAAYFATLRSPQEPVFTHWWEPNPTQ